MAVLAGLYQNYACFLSDFLVSRIRNPGSTSSFVLFVNDSAVILKNYQSSFGLSRNYLMPELLSNGLQKALKNAKKLQ
ncbi:hypothetical Protein YC6258_01855 [Gynuella sunshinyii YC6258]|uniref:Uncharacterized protein n=1 Tax=Gynuella sunshinyii YC6258 TaxID=1445510 RepID=A0A0C5VU43_9GAMM|nr:hypothetical Protein YC6258_01855 [Gynuella sunshinyii YC6258]